ncbi:MAG: ATP-binding cassette domain-containing protein [Candidatus Aminicenantes bacterium]|nr:ATP-binding cassette domain-containing protein [Candidatus Aminicenantes bacterium]
MLEPIVEVEGLTKVFKSLKAVNKVSFSIYSGEILGLLGPNGAGKTTIMHMLLGLTTPNEGEVKIFGRPLAKHRKEIIQEANFSSNYVSMPNSLTVKECLKVFARLYQVKNKEQKITELLKIFEIDDIRNKLVRHLSSGQQTRLNLAKSLINDPKILFLDEPTASLDPDIADKTRRLLQLIKKKSNISILYTSHNMKEMEEMSDRIIFLHKGNIIAEGRPADVIKRFKRKDLEEVFLKVAREERY